MSKVSVTKEKLDTLAEAVGAKSGQSIPLTIDQMTNAVLSIQDIYNQNKTLTPTESRISVTADNGYSGLGTVTVEPISSYYIGSAVSQNDSTNVTINNLGYVNVENGYYPNTVIKTFSTQGGKTIYPQTRSTQTAVAANKYTTGAIYVNPIKLESATTITPTNSTQIIRPTAINVLVDNWYAYDISGSQFYKNDVNLSSLVNGTRILIYGALGITNNGGATTETQVKETFVWQGSSETIQVGTAGSSASLYFDKTNNRIRLNTNGYYDAYRFTILNSQYDGLSQVVVNSVPTENRTFTSNGTYTPTSGKWIDSVTVNVPTGSTINNQNKTVTPTESQQSVTYDSGYTGLETVTVDAISNTYVGSGITQRNSTDLTVSGDTVTVPAGYYAAQATKSVDTMALPTSAVASATSGYTSAATISRSTSDQYINIPTGYNTAGAYYKVNAVPNGSATTPTTTINAVPSLTVSASGLITAAIETSESITPTVVEGYVSTGTAGTVSVAGGVTRQLTTKGAATITPGTTNQTIASGTYLTGTQTISGDADLVAGNIKSGVTIFGVEGTYTGAGATINSLTVTPTTSQQVFDSSGIDGYKPVTVNAIPNASANPSLDLVNYTTSGNNYVLQGTNDDPAVPFYSTDGQARIVLPKAIMGNATTGQVLSGATFTSANGVAISGAMDNNGALGGTITTQGGTYTIPAGYTSGGTVTASLTAGSLTNSIINGASFEETTGDYGFRATVNIPAGYYNATQLTKDFSTILPAPDTEGTAAQVLIGYDLYNHEGEVISGTMTNNGTWDRTLDQTTTSVTIPAGYHSGSGTVSHTTVNIPDPTITVSSSGLITASGSWTRGFTTDNSYSNTEQLSTQAAATITPSETAQTAVASGKYTTGAVTVAAIPANYVGSGVTTRTSSDVTVTNSTGVVNVPAGYYATAASKQLSTQAGTTITPTESEQTAVAAYKWTTGAVKVGAISSTYVGSGITQRDSTDLSASGATVTVPAGYYSSAASASIANGVATNSGTASASSATITTGTNTITLSKAVSITPDVTAGYISSGTAGSVTVSLTGAATINPTPTASGKTVTTPAGYYTAAVTTDVATMTLPTSASASATSGYISKATIGRSTSDQYINIPTGYNTAGGYYKISAVANGSVTAPSSISGTTASVSTGTNTLTLTKTVSVTPNVTTAGYISSGTAGNSTVTLTANVTTKGTATITPTTSNQTISSGTYITGTQTIVGDADLVAGNIKSGVSIFGVTGTYAGLDTSDATATAADIVSGETAYVNGRKVEGSLVVQTYYTGSTVPSSSLGINGDIYLQS